MLLQACGRVHERVSVRVHALGCVRVSECVFACVSLNDARTWKDKLDFSTKFSKRKNVSLLGTEPDGADFSRIQDSTDVVIKCRDSWRRRPFPLKYSFVPFDPTFSPR